MASGGSGENKKPHKGTENLRPYKPGQSGNPSGRKPVPAEVKALFAENALPIAQALVKTALNVKHRDHVKAAQTVYERLFGRATEHGIRVFEEPKSIDLTPEAVIAGGVAALSAEIMRLASIVSQGQPLQPSEIESLPQLIKAHLALTAEGDRIAQGLTDEQLSGRLAAFKKGHE
jgi:hypothetical protein